MHVKRILLKLSGEIFCNIHKSNYNDFVLSSVILEIIQLHKKRIQIAIVIGGGNIFRGSYGNKLGMNRLVSDKIGMMATVINALILQEFLLKANIISFVQSTIYMPNILETYVVSNAIKYLEDGNIVIFAGGTGSPYCTTDTAAGLRARDISANILFKMTKVDGVFNKDPLLNNRAIMYNELSYLDVLSKKLKIMDSTAISICMEHNITIYVINMKKNNIMKILNGEKIGTKIYNKQ